VSWANGGQTNGVAFDDQPPPFFFESGPNTVLLQANRQADLLQTGAGVGGSTWKNFSGNLSIRQYNQSTKIFSGKLFLIDAKIQGEKVFLCVVSQT
jgi:hypothetical protein